MSDDFEGSISDLSSQVHVVTERDLAAELFKGAKVQTTIDRLEAELGITKSKAATKIERKTAILYPEDSEDAAFLSKLLNDEKYKIIVWNTNWSVRGDLKIFVIFEEILEKSKAV